MKVVQLNFHMFQLTLILFGINVCPNTTGYKYSLSFQNLMTLIKYIIIFPQLSSCPRFCNLVELKGRIPVLHFVQTEKYWDREIIMVIYFAISLETIQGRVDVLNASINKE